MEKPTDKQVKRDRIKKLLPLDSIAESAINAKARIIPVGKNKAPLISGWEKPGEGSYDREQLYNWIATFKNPYWGCPCGPTNNIFIFDADFKKNPKTKEIIGPPELGDIKQEWLDQSSFSQSTKSTFNGKHTFHFGFKWEDRFKFFTNRRIPTTTCDLRVMGGQFVIYRPLPPPHIWNDLNPMPEEMVQLLLELLKIKESDKKQWSLGNRNNTLFKKIAQDMEKNQGRKIPSIIEKAKKSGLSKEEIRRTAESATKTAIESGIDPGPEPPIKKVIIPKKNIYKPFTPIPKPREWFLNKKIFIKGRPNQFTGDPGAGKSTFTRFIAFRYWELGGTIIMFAQEDSPSEDIAPFLVHKGFKEGEQIPRFFIFWDWIKHPPNEVLREFKHIKDKFVVFDPVHALFIEVGKPAYCRKVMLTIQNECLAPGDTSVYVNHPKSFWKENKLSGAEINAGTKELGRICRGSTILKVNKESGLNIIEHSKRQLAGDRYAFNLVEDYIKNNEGKVCTFSNVENFKALKETQHTEDTVTPVQKKLSKRREKIRKAITDCCVSKVGEWIPKTTIQERVKNLKLEDLIEDSSLSAKKSPDKVKKLKIKDWELDRELSDMVSENAIERGFEDRKARYRHGKGV